MAPDNPTVQLREYIERILDEREKAQVATFKAEIRETDAKARELERRLEGLNELRAEVTRDRNKFVERDALDMRLAPILERLQRAEQSGVKTAAFVAGIITAIGLAINLVLR